MKVKLDVILEIDVDDERVLDNVISEMNYEFSHIVSTEQVGKQLDYYNIIKSSEIIGYDIL